MPNLVGLIVTRLHQHTCKLVTSLHGYLETRSYMTSQGASSFASPGYDFEISKKNWIGWLRDQLQTGLCF